MRKIRFKENLLALVALVSMSTSCSDDAPTYKSLWDAEGQQNKIAIISDLHLGVDDAYSETVANRPYLVDFLKRLQVTKDIKELVIVGDFLDEWYLPYSYTEKITDEDKFYKEVIQNNQTVIDELKNVVKSGIKLVYVPGNHDLTMKSNILYEAIPGIVQITDDAQGLGTYYTGNRREIAIEHGHRYDIFSAPDCVSNEELCGNHGNTILPAGYFYAVNGASWVLEGMPRVDKSYPKIDEPENMDQDQEGAWKYFCTIENTAKKHTPYEDPNEPHFKMHFAGFDADYSYMDFYPQLQSNGTISSKLYKNIQQTWTRRQELNNVKVNGSFIEGILGTADTAPFYHKLAKRQYLDNPNENVEVVVFGHTHKPDYKMENGKCYVNDGTWVDYNTNAKYTRTFVVITPGTTDKVCVYTYGTDGNILDITSDVAKTSVPQ